MSGLTYLITGANRGIGKALLEVFASRPNTTVIAAVRDVKKSTKDLASVPVDSSSRIIIVKIDSTSETDPEAAVAELASKYNITSLDILIANAGHMGEIVTTLKTKASELRRMLEVNTIGPLTLIQAFAPLLRKSAKPQFLVLTSTIGTLGNMDKIPVPFFGYGLSKAAANYLVRKLHFENPWLISMAFNPGWVQTDMGDGAAAGVGMESAPLTLAESIPKLVKNMDAASRKISGTFTEVDGSPVPW